MPSYCGSCLADAILLHNGKNLVVCLSLHVKAKLLQSCCKLGVLGILGVFLSIMV